jgi:hypothetical protein
MQPLAFRVALCAGWIGAVAAGCTEPSLPPCHYEASRTIPLDELTAEGDSGGALLNRAAGSWHGTMTWKGTPTGTSLEIVPTAGATPIDVTVTSTASEATYLPASASQGKGLCPASLSVAAVARVVTGDGGLDETWAISLENVPPAGARVSVDLQQQPLQGSLHVYDPQAVTWDQTWFGATATFTASAAAGAIYYGAERTRGNQGEGYSADVGEWTAGPLVTDGGSP